MSWQSFDEFYANTFSRLLAAAVLACGDRGDAEDAVQDAFLAALGDWERISGYDLPDAWVLKVALRRLWRVRRRQRRGADESLTVTISPQSTPEQTAEASEVLAALAGLPRDVRVALVACAVLGWTQEEVAELVGVPRGTIANRIFRGRAVLATQLGLGGTVAGARDSLVPAPRIFAPSVIPDDDLVADALGRTERWLRAGVESEPGTAERIRAGIAERAGGGTGPRRPLAALLGVLPRPRGSRAERAGGGRD